MLVFSCWLTSSLAEGYHKCRLAMGKGKHKDLRRYHPVWSAPIGGVPLELLVDVNSSVHNDRKVYPLFQELHYLFAFPR
jgi:hypothetical protein